MVMATSSTCNTVGMAPRMREWGLPALACWNRAVWCFWSLNMASHNTPNIYSLAFSFSTSLMTSTLSLLAASPVFQLGLGDPLPLCIDFR